MKRTSRRGTFLGDVATEFSDVILAQSFKMNEAMNLTVGNQTCQVSALDDRSWLGVRGRAPSTTPMTSCLTRAFEATQLVNGTTTAQPTTTVTGTSGSCELESEVPCCPDGSCPDRCTGTQCCPSSGGSRTCPSASSVQVSTCERGKKFDCTGTTGVAPPGRLSGTCEFPNPPAIGYYWEPFCFFGMLGCFADGKNVECRFCGSGDFIDVTCKTTTTTTTTSSTTTMPGLCPALTSVLKSCSDDGCTVLAGGMLSRTCRQYCEEHHLICVAAWEDSDDDCNVLASLSCDQIYQGTPDLICQCAPQPPPPAIWIQNQAGLCLMAKEFNVSGAAVSLYPCGPPNPSAQWIHHRSAQLTNANQDMRRMRCLHAAEQDPGALLVMLPCSDDEAAQNFTLDETTSQIRISSGLCLEWRSGDELVVTAVCGLSANQLWYWGENPVATTTTTVGWTETEWGRPSPSAAGLLQHFEGHCVSDKLTMVACDPGSDAQFFSFNQTLLQVSSGGLCLESSTGSGVVMRVCDPSRTSQQFAFNLQSGMIWNRQLQCLEAADPLVPGALVHLKDCNSSKSEQHWFFNSAATTTLAPVSVGLHIRLESGICLAAKENASRSCLELRGCREEDVAQKWFYDETSNQLKNGFGKCLMAPHAGGIRKAKISFTRFGSGENRACRGSSWQDNDKSNYIAFWPVDALETCKDRCRERTSCKGIEFNPDLRRCEVWIKPVTLAVTTVANFSCYTASLEDPTLAIFEDVDGGSERVCRGNNPGDNSLSYFTLSLAESKEDCQRQCSMATGRCTGFEYHKTGRCELWSKPVGASANLSGYFCRALATVIMNDCNTSDFRQLWNVDSMRGQITSVQDGACLDAIGRSTSGNRVRLLTCNSESASQLWEVSTEIPPQEVRPLVVSD